MKFSVLGCGRWGSFITWYLSEKKGFDTTLCGREDSARFNALVETGHNEYVNLNKSVKLTNDLSVATSSADCIVISISAQELRGFISNIVKSYDITNKKIILCMKGMEVESCKRLTEVCIEEGVDRENIAVWLGPGHIQDFTRGIPNCMTIDAYNESLSKELANVLSSDIIRFYYGSDIIGSEIGAACKNIMGICAGLLDGYGYSTLKGPLMSRGAYEVSKFITAMGGDGYSAYGLTHLGDYETTLFSKYSNNRQFGEQLASNLPYVKLAEGVSTCKAVADKARELGVDMPITFAIYSVLFDKVEPKTVLTEMFNRTIKVEKYSK